MLKKNFLMLSNDVQKQTQKTNGNYFSWKKIEKLYRAILLYLIPVKMFLGKMPKESLLKEYNLYQFENLSKAVQLGNLQLFTETLEKYQDFFIQKGIYLLIEKLTMLTYRNLFKKVYVFSNVI